MRNARLAISSKKSNRYDMMVKPKLWKALRGTKPVALHAVIISICPSQPLRRERDSIVLLTREKLPCFPSFPIYLENDTECDVNCSALNFELQPTDKELEILTTFTLRIFQDVFQKIYDRDIKMMTYWLAPLNPRWEGNPKRLDSRDVLDWDILQTVLDNPTLSWTSDRTETYSQNCFIYDKWDGRYRYFTLGIEPCLRPTDPPPSSMARRRHMSSIMDYCLSLYKNARKRFLETCDWNQPVIRVELAQLRRNVLDKRTEKEKQKEGPYFVCLEALAISAVSSLGFHEVEYIN